MQSSSGVYCFTIKAGAECDGVRPFQVLQSVAVLTLRAQCISELRSIIHNMVAYYFFTRLTSVHVLVSSRRNLMFVTPVTFGIIQQHCEQQQN
jgi:hypothetical protein